MHTIVVPGSTIETAPQPGHATLIAPAMPMGAAGFAVDTDAVTMKTLSDANVSYSDNPDVLVFAGDGCEMQAIALVEQLISEGKKAQFSVLETLEETERFAKERGIAEVRICSR